VKFQRSSEAFLQRYGAETSHWDPNSLTQLAPFVQPVVLLGHDFIDAERSTFYFASFRAALAANAGYVAVRADEGDAQLLGLSVSLPAGGGFDVQIALANVFAFAGTGAPVNRTQSGDGRSNLYGEAGYEIVPFPSIFFCPANGSVQVPLEGAILQQGYAVWVKAATVNVAISACLYFRNVVRP